MINLSFKFQEPFMIFRVFNLHANVIVVGANNMLSNVCFMLHTLPTFFCHQMRKGAHIPGI